MSSWASFHQRFKVLEAELRRETSESQQPQRKTSIDLNPEQSAPVNQPTNGNNSDACPTPPTIRSNIQAFLSPSLTRFSGRSFSVGKAGIGRNLALPSFLRSSPNPSSPQSTGNNMNNHHVNNNPVAESHPQNLPLDQLAINPAVNAQCLSPRPRPRMLPLGLDLGRPQSPGTRRQPQPLVPTANRQQQSSRSPLNNPFLTEEHTRSPHTPQQLSSERFPHNNLITIDEKQYSVTENDLEDLAELGSGSCGHVRQMRHKKTDRLVAVKQMRRSGDEHETKKIATDLDILLKCSNCIHVVQCYGYIIKDAEVWICMELMSSCFEKILKKLGTSLPEDILGKVTVSTVKALHYLKEKHKVMHRDIKPSNILVNEKGVIKLCDFGISGNLIDSKARTRGAGCTAYLSPERIHPDNRSGYDIRADVWSFGLTLVELSQGRFPYVGANCDFEILTKIVNEEPPKPPTDKFSANFCDFCAQCLNKDVNKRPKYPKLLEHVFLKEYETKEVDVAGWFASVMS